MITSENLEKAGLDKEKSGQVIELLGDIASKLYPEDGYAKAMGDIDRAILTHWNVPKNNDEKTSDYFKRVSSLKETEKLQAKEAELKKEIEDLTKKLDAKPGDEVLKKELQDAKAEIAKIPDLIDAQTKEWKDKYEKSESELDIFKKKSSLIPFIPKFKSDLDDEFVSYKKNKIINEILEKFEIQTAEDNSLIIYDPSTHKRTPVKDYFDSKFDNMIDKGVNQNGGGAGTGSGGNGSGSVSELKMEADWSDGKKITSIREHLAGKGVDITDKDYSAQFNKLALENKLEKYSIPEEKK